MLTTLVNDPDGVKILVPATWNVPGATAVPTTRNKDMAAGRLAAFPAPASEILASGIDALSVRLT